MVQSGSLVPTRNSFTYLSVAKLRCRRRLLRSGLTDCTDSRPETVFSLCRLLKSCVSSKFSIFIAFPSSLLFFLSKLLPSIIKWTFNKNRPILHSLAASPELRQRKRSCLWLLDSSHAEKIRKQEYYYETVTVLILIAKSSDGCTHLGHGLGSRATPSYDDPLFT